MEWSRYLDFMSITARRGSRYDGCRSFALLILPALIMGRLSQPFVAGVVHHPQDVCRWQTKINGVYDRSDQSLGEFHIAMTINVHYP